MQTLKEEIQALSLKISAVTDYFYQQKMSEAYQGMELLLASLTSMVANLSSYQKEQKEFSYKQQDLLKILKEAMQALEEKDAVLLADILEYELKAFLESLESQLP